MLNLCGPHLEYGCVIWDPYTTKGKKSMEKVQHFACKLATKRWDASYEELLGLLELPTLEERRVHMKLCLLYKIIHELCYIPSGITGTVLSIRSHSLLLHQPFARTNAYFHIT